MRPAELSRTSEHRCRCLRTVNGAMTACHHLPNATQYVLKQRMDNFVKGRPMVRKLGPVLGHGIFASDGARWKAHRKLASNIFSVRRCV